MQGNARKNGYNRNKQARRRTLDIETLCGAMCRWMPRFPVVVSRTCLSYNFSKTLLHLCTFTN